MTADEMYNHWVNGNESIVAQALTDNPVEEVIKDFIQQLVEFEHPDSVARLVMILASVIHQNSVLKSNSSGTKEL